MLGSRAAKYRRISEDREGREAGVERQNEDLDALAERHGLTVVADYVDNDLGASTRSRKPRPAYLEMLDAAKAGKFDVILAYTSGRLTRRPREHEDLIELAEQHGIRYLFHKSPSFDLNTAAGRRIARILAANDAGEAEDISERVSRAAEQRAKQGLNHGGYRCFGYTADGLHLVPAEAAEVANMARALLGGVPLASVARDLATRDVPTVRGGRWGPGTVRDLMMRPRLAGLASWRGEIVGPGQWPAIITEHEHHALVAMLTDPTRRTTTGNRAGYLLSGWARCGKCGGHITSAGIKRHDGGYRHIYKCRARHCTGRRRDWCDSYVAEVIIARLSRPDAADLLVDRDLPDLAALQQEQTALRVRLEDLAADYGDGVLDRAQLRAGTERIRARLAEIGESLQHTSRGPILAELVDADDVREVWEGLSLDRQRAVAQTLVNVTLHPGGAGTRDRKYIPAYVEITWKEE